MESFPQRSNPTVDRISDLPDAILCHILSFLPTKQAFTTSFLSKRWKPVWLSVLALNFDFDDETFKDFDSFHKFIYSTMFKLRDKKTSIHSFSLKLGKPCYSSYINQKQLNRIFKFVMKRGGVNLNLNMDPIRRIIKLPRSILSFKTLQVLKLTFLSIRDFDQMDFPVLKTLHLHLVKFKSQEYCVKFLFGCPVLEDLHIQNIFYTRQSLVPMENMNALPNLVKVRIFYSTKCTPMTLFCNAKVLHIEKMWISRNWLLEEVLPYFPKLQNFIIEDCVKAHDCWMDPQTAPECILSQLKTCCIRGYKDTIYEFEFVKYIIQHSKVLETMTIECSTCLLKDQKDQMVLKLSSWARDSTTCELLFD